MQRIERRKRIVRKRLLELGASMLVLTLLIFVFTGFQMSKAVAKEEVKVGLMIPLTHIEAIFGQSMLNSARVAIQEYNNSDGKFKLVPFLEDTATNPGISVERATKLIEESQVDVIIGTLMSSVRQAVFTVTKKHKMIFMNPTYDEGGRFDRYYFSTGAVINQQFGKFIPWIIKNFGPKFYLVGSDYSWPRGSFALAKKIIAEHGGEVVGEEYVGFGVPDFSDVIRRITIAKPDTLIPLVAGSDGVTFLKQFVDFGLKKKIKICSSGFTELSINGMDPESADGIYSVADYFMTVDTPQNKEFLAKYRAMAGKDALVDLFGVNMYNNVHLYAQALERTGTKDRDAVAKALRGMTFRSPAGEIMLDPNTHYAHLMSFVGVSKKNIWPYLEIVDDFGRIAPEPGGTVH